MSWRENSKAGKWSNIWPWDVPHDELPEIYEALSKVVPRRMKGDGIETYEDFIYPEDAKDYATWSAASLLGAVRKRLDSGNRPSPISEFLSTAVGAAIERLAAHGIHFEGMHDTYLFWDSTGELVQVRRDIGAALVARHRSWFDAITYGFSSFDSHVEREAVIELERKLDLYPWRRVDNLHTHWRCRRFPENSALDHAIALLDSYRCLRVSLEEARIPQYHGAIGNRGERAVDAMYLANHAFTMGREYEALIKKAYEEHAIRGIKTIRSAREGGMLRAAKVSPHSNKVLSEMRALIDGGHSISRAADLVFKRGIGRSQGANRRLWDRHKK